MTRLSKTNVSQYYYPLGLEFLPNHKAKRDFKREASSWEMNKKFHESANGGIEWP